MIIFNLKKYDSFQITGRGTVFVAHRNDNDIEGIKIGSIVKTDDGKFYDVVGIEKFRNMTGIGKNVGLLVKEHIMTEAEESERKYEKHIHQDENTEMYPVSIWNELVQLGMIGNYDGSGYWMKDGKASRDEVFSTPPFDATHVIWYSK